jgi:truncated hemoglobin YjbI
MIGDLFDQIGGRSAVEAATELFYDKVLHDDSLRHFFEQVDMAHLHYQQAMFITMLLGGRVYTSDHQWLSLHLVYTQNGRTGPYRLLFTTTIG